MFYIRCMYMCCIKCMYMCYIRHNSKQNELSHNYKYWNFTFLWRWKLRLRSWGMWRRLVWHRGTNISEECIASVVRTKRGGDQEWLRGERGEGIALLRQSNRSELGHRAWWIEVAQWERETWDQWVWFVLHEDGGSWLARNVGVRPSDDKAPHFEGDNMKCW